MSRILPAAFAVSLVIGVVLAAGLVPLNVAGNPPLVDAPVAFILNGNQCDSTAGNMPSPCSTGCYYYQCNTMTAASPGIIQNTTDSNGNADLTIQSYSTGSACGYLASGFTCNITSYPFYELAIYSSGHWQLTPWQFYPGLSSSPFTVPVNDSYTGLSYGISVKVCLSSCSSPLTYSSSVTTLGTTVFTTTVVKTTIIAGQASTVNSVATVTSTITASFTQSVRTSSGVATSSVTSTAASSMTTFVPKPVSSGFGIGQMVGVVITIVSVDGLIITGIRKQEGV